MSWSDHRVVVEVDRASSRSFKWVFIVYLDVMCFRVLGDFGGLGDWLDWRDTSVHLSRHEDDSRVC